MATLFEILGEGTYTQLLAVCSPEPTPEHPYAACKSPSRCPAHRRTYRKLLKARAEASVFMAPVSIAETALRLLAEEAPLLPEERLDDLARLAHIDPTPTRLESVTRGEALRTVARRALYVDGKA